MTAGAIAGLAIPGLAAAGMNGVAPGKPIVAGRIMAMGPFGPGMPAMRAAIGAGPMPRMPGANIAGPPKGGRDAMGDGPPREAR